METGVFLIDISGQLRRIRNQQVLGSSPSAGSTNSRSPANWATLLASKDTSDAYLLTPTIAADTAQRLFGAPVFTSTWVPDANVIAADMAHVVFGWRTQIRIDYSSEGRWFLADQTAVRAITRFDVGVLNADALQLATGIV